MTVGSSITLSYDNCYQSTGTETGELELIDTHWTNIYRMNAITYTVLSAMVLLSCMGLFVKSIFSASLSCLQIAGLGHIVVIAVTGYYRLNDVGKLCAE